jgi:hypothetical protein
VEKLPLITPVSRLALVPIGQCEWRLEQEENSRKSAINRNSVENQVVSLRRETTGQDCYRQGIHFERAWAQKWAQFENLADFWLLNLALSC